MEYTIFPGIEGICPPGWHIPDEAEWKTLEGAVDSQYGIADPIWNNTGFRGYDAGKKLKTTMVGKREVMAQINLASKGYPAVGMDFPVLILQERWLLGGQVLGT